MYEDTKKSIDWKGLFLKVVIAFLIILIAIKGYSTLKGNNKVNEKTTTETTAESKSSSTFTENIEKLRNAGEKYFTNNKDKLPKQEGNTVMVTLNELVSNGEIEALADEDGKTCDGESSYVTAMLEGNKTKIKANLVCGDASSYSLVYMGENDDNIEENKTTNNNSYTKTNTSSSKSSNTCTTNNCGTSSVNVSTNTSVSQNVSINSGKTNSNSNSNSSNNNNNYNTTRKVTVSFDSNGGNRSYSSQRINVNSKAYNPGSPSKSGYTFLGWYLNGYKYNFNTPVTKNITLVAKYSRNYSNDDDDYYYDDYIGSLRTGTYTSYVYTMGWDTRGTDYISIDHTLRLPEYLEDRDIERVKISNITFNKSLNTSSLANTYKSRHRDTFFYERNGWESSISSTNSLSTIKSNAVDFYYSSRYKDIDDAIYNGFDVNWTANDVYKQCTTTFSVNGESNKCNYGIVYKVTWTYQYYN